VNCLCAAPRINLRNEKQTSPQPCKQQSKIYVPNGETTDDQEVQRLLGLPEDGYSEIQRLIGRIVIPYVDPSNTLLHLEELKAECLAKLARLIDESSLKRCPTRARLFAYLKTAFKNHVRSLIQKQVYCLKRAGVRPLTKEERSNPAFKDHRPPKPIKLSLDDPESGVEVPYWDTHDRPEDLLADFERNLSAAERLVLRQLINPNEQARRLAESAESGPGNSRVMKRRRKISSRHLAEGLEMPLEAFLEIARRVRVKCREFIRQ
jgi:hypothetical protein